MRVIVYDTIYSIAGEIWVEGVGYYTKHVREKATSKGG